MLRRSCRFFTKSPQLSASETYTRGGKSVTRLNNGLRVLSWDDATALSTVGVFTQLGPRFEEDNLSEGCSTIFDRFLLHSNQKTNATALAEDFSHMGNSVTTTNHRECVSYLLQCPRYHVPQALDVLSGALLAPDVDDADTLERVKRATIQTIPQRIRDPTKWCFELLHNAAFNDKTLGRSALFTEEHINRITAESMHNFLDKYVRSNTTVVTASAVSDHNAFVDDVIKCFEFHPATSPSSAAPVAIEKAVFTGGLRTHHDTRPPESVVKFSEKNHTHIAVFFPTPSGVGKEYFTQSVIQCLMGGGQSFSSGGPGKGMLTKLYRDVMSREGWIHSIECVTASYTDCSMIGLYGSAPHDYHQHLLDVLLEQVSTIPHKVEEYHVQMAKQHLLSQFYLVNDTSTVLMEDAGRQLLLFDDVLSFQTAKERLESVSLADIKEMCAAMTAQPPAVSVYGNTTGLKSYEQIVNTVLQHRSRRK
eukprot:PhM_4_TR2174/c0_g1_i1/m.13008/K01412/PMPCA, MAS2; mitochondrial-processing peptidase subunit alpha